MTKEEKIQLLRKHMYSDSLSCRLFCNNAEVYRLYRTERGYKTSLYCFNDGDEDSTSYACFLNNVRNKEDLVMGLTELRPFADDALEVARRMTDSDFVSFKLALICERQGKGGKISDTERIIVLPDQILRAMVIAQKVAAPVGAVLVQMLKIELDV